MKWASKCPLCGGEVIEKKVEKLLKGGSDTAVIEVTAGVCLKCGEHVYTPETIERFEEIREKLKNHVVDDFKRIGNTYAVASS